MFPRGTSVTGNFVHEIGHIQKQSSFYFQAESAEVRVHDAAGRCLRIQTC